MPVVLEAKVCAWVMKGRHSHVRGKLDWMPWFLKIALCSLVFSVCLERPRLLGLMAHGAFSAGKGWPGPPRLGVEVRISPRCPPWGQEA